jgi:hypothetical protein
MNFSDLSDIILGAVSVPFIVYFIYVIVIVARNKEIEFNRMWRTRLFVVFCALLFSVAYTAGNLNIFGKQLNKDNGPKICCAFSLVEFGFFYNLFVFYILTVLRLVTSLDTLDTINPNKLVLKYMFYSFLPGFLICIGIYLAMFFVGNKSLLSTFDEDDNVCYTSSAYSIFSLIIIVIIIIINCRMKNTKVFMILNTSQQNMVSEFPLWMIIFIVGSIASAFSQYLSDTYRFIAELVTSLIYNFGFCVFIFYLVHKPIKESLKYPIIRGTITKRHQQFTA